MTILQISITKFYISKPLYVCSMLDDLQNLRNLAANLTEEFRMVSEDFLIGMWYTLIIKYIYIVINDIS